MERNTRNTGNSELNNAKKAIPLSTAMQNAATDYKRTYDANGMGRIVETPVSSPRVVTTPHEMATTAKNIASEHQAQKVNGGVQPTAVANNTTTDVDMNDKSANYNNYQTQQQANGGVVQTGPIAQQPQVQTPVNAFKQYENERQGKEVLNPFAIGDKDYSETNLSAHRIAMYDKLNQIAGYNNYKAMVDNDQLKSPDNDGLTLNDPNAPRTLTQEEWNEQHPIEDPSTAIKTPTMPNEQEDGRSNYQKFRDSMWDEEGIRKKSQQRAKVLAIGDALRNIGNLYYTTKGAVPQNLQTNFADEERKQYETGKQNRDALAYKMYQAKQADDIAKAKLASQQIKDQSQMELNKARVSQIYQNIGINEKKFPLEYNKLLGDSIQSLAEGNIKQYEATIKQLEASNKPMELQLANMLKQAEIQYKKDAGRAALTNASAHMISAKASAAQSYASARHMNAQTQKIFQEISDSNGERLVSGNIGRFKTPKKFSTLQKESLIAELRKNKSVTDEMWARYHQKPATGLDVDENTLRALRADEVIAECISKCKSREAKDIFKRYGFTEVNGDSDFSELR